MVCCPSRKCHHFRHSPAPLLGDLEEELGDFFGEGFEVDGFAAGVDDGDLDIVRGGEGERDALGAVAAHAFDDADLLAFGTGEDEDAVGSVGIGVGGGSDDEGEGALGGIEAGGAAEFADDLAAVFGAEHAVGPCHAVVLVDGVAAEGICQSFIGELDFLDAGFGFVGGGKIGGFQGVGLDAFELGDVRGVESEGALTEFGFVGFSGVIDGIGDSVER